MKEPIEELFKQSLEGHEMPYNPDAWAAMSARLDVVSPVAPPTSYLKYYIGAAVVGVAAITTYFVVSSTATETILAQVAEQTVKQTTVPTVQSNSEKSEANSTATGVTTEASQTQNTDINGSNTGNTAHQPATVRSNGSVSGNPSQTTSPYNNEPDVYIVPEWNTAPIQPEQATKAPVKIILPSIADLCLNEETTITNSNANDIYLLNGLKQVVKTIPAKKAIIFRPEKVGTYMLAWTNNGEFEVASNFNVNRIPDADFMVDVVNKFDNGLPSTHVEAIGGQGSYTWKAPKQSATGLEADLHFYTKGDHKIELTVNNGQCAAKVEKIITIERDYNLMAVTGFTPSSNDPKTNTFMPFALTQRDVQFELTIIDSRDGGVVYETSDASLPWDGTDIRFGRRSASPQVYVWKVVIFNPAPNEKNEYLGTITMN